MSEAKIIFTLDGVNLTIQCTPEDKIKDICQKYATKVGSNINSLTFLYGGNQMNMEKKFKEQASSFDQSRNEMNVLVIRIECDDFTCPNCGSKIKLKTEKLDEIISSNKNIQDTINGIKFNIENIIKISTNNTINIQLKMIKTLFDTMNEDINKSNAKLKTLLQESINTIENKFQNIKLNEVNNSKSDQELELPNGKYIGQVVNGKAEGKGILYAKNSKYEGDFKNNVFEGKGIMHLNNGDIYEGEFKNDLKEGKGIYYYKNGDIYEGDYKNDLREGKGIYYFNNGDREMGDYKNDKPIGKHIRLTKNGEVETINY